MFTKIFGLQSNIDMHWNNGVKLRSVFQHLHTYYLLQAFWLVTIDPEMRLFMCRLWSGPKPFVIYSPQVTMQVVLLTCKSISLKYIWCKSHRTRQTVWTQIRCCLRATTYLAAIRWLNIFQELQYKLFC